jgi:hypothetical protein
VGVAEGDELRISASLQDDISAALTKIEARLKSVEDAVGKMGKSGAKGGEEFAAGADRASKAADKMGTQARQAKRPVDQLGDAAEKAGAKAAAGSTGLDAFAKKAEKAGKKGGGLGSIMKVFKFAGMVSGAFALAGGISALGAGAVIAIGGLAPLVGVLGGVLPIFAAAKLSMLAFTLAAVAMKPTLDGIKKQFTDLGPIIAKGGLQSGLDYFSKSLKGLVKVSGTGLSGLGAEMGQTARSAGDLAKSAPFLDQVSKIFSGLRPIVGSVSQGLLFLVKAVLNVVQAGIPAAQGMGEAFKWVASSLAIWTKAQLDNGNLTKFITQAWLLLLRVIGVAVDIFIGVFNIFKVGAGYAGDMGKSIEAAAYSFRLWTTSAAGQSKINAYFQQSLPALHEMGKLLGDVAGALGHLGGNQNIAPLLAQIRSEFLPALEGLIQKLSGQGGLGPALIDAATQLAKLFTGLNFSAMTMFVQGIAGIVSGLVWLSANVPGAGFAISALLGTMLGFKLLAPVWTLVGKGASAFSWMGTALAGTEKLSIAQKLFAGGARLLSLGFVKVGGAIVGTVIPAIKAFAMAGLGALKSLTIALFTTPIGWIILAIIAVIAAIWLLWTKCAWFRDAVMAVWKAIQVAAIAVWNALIAAGKAVFTALKTAFEAIGNAAVAVWDAIKTAWNATVNFIIMVAMWIWDHGLKQVVTIIVTAMSIAWSIIKGIVQVAIYIIIAIIVFLAVQAKAMWDQLVMGAEYAWSIITGAAAAFWNWLKPILQAIGDFFVFIFTWASNTVSTFWTNIQAGAAVVWDWITQRISDFWGWLQPILAAIGSFFGGVWDWIVQKATDAWNFIMQPINAFWNWLQPILAEMQLIGSAVWLVISTKASELWANIKQGWSNLTGWLSGIFNTIGKAGSGLWDGISAAAGHVGDFIKGVWNGLVGIVKGAWNFIAKGWNSIPSITVPSWIPGIGGKTFGLPKLPTLWHGGEAPGGAAIVGEHGPEPLVQNGRVTGMVGLNGPEITGIPKGGYVVPNLRTLSSLPGLAKTLPAGVAAAVARSVPGYSGALGAPSGGSGGGSSSALAAQVGRLANAVGNQLPQITINGNGKSIHEEVLDAMRTINRERDASSKYSYGGRR